MTAQQDHIYQVKVTLTGSSPPIWRRLLVPGQISLAQLHDVMPELRDAVVLEERYLNRRDCPAFPPGSWSTRPGVETPIDGLALAGDYLGLPFPAALMEKATASGFMAANHLMERWDLRPEPLWSVPTHGLTASFYK